MNWVFFVYIFMFKIVGGKLYGVFVLVIVVLIFKYFYVYMYGFKLFGFIMCYLVKKWGKYEMK